MPQRKEKIDKRDQPSRKTRTVRRRRVRRVERSRDVFVQHVLSLSKKIEPEEVERVFRHLRRAGLRFGSAEEFLSEFDWSAALRLLPHMMEFAESYKTLTGPDKEKRVLALLLHFARAAKHEEVFDENGVQSLRLVIGMMIDVSHGRFKLNEANAARALRLVKHGSLWAFKHCSCGACCRCCKK